MVMVLGQRGGWLGGLGLYIAIEFHVDGVVGSTLDGGFRDWLWCWSWRCLIGELLLDLQVGVDGVHAEVEIRAVLLVVLGANMRTRFFCWSENVGRGATLNGHDNNYYRNGNIVKSCWHAKAGEIRSSSAQIFFFSALFLVIDFLLTTLSLFSFAKIGKLASTYRWTKHSRRRTGISQANVELGGTHSAV